MARPVIALMPADESTRQPTTDSGERKTESTTESTCESTCERESFTGGFSE